MWRELLRKIRKWPLLSQGDASPATPREPLLTSNLKHNLDAVQDTLGKSPDVVIRRFTIGSRNGPEAAVVFIDGLVDAQRILTGILRPLIHDQRREEVERYTPDYIRDHVVTVGEVKTAKELREVTDGALSGDTALLINGRSEALIFSTRQITSRGVEEPTTELTVRGPKEGFTETLRTNTALLRRRIRHPNLTFDVMRVGVQTRTDVCVAYLKGITGEPLVNEIKERLRRIETDAILDSGYIEEFIEDAPMSPFTTVGNSERPDVIAGKILEGRAAILVDGSPFVLTVPMLFWEGFQSPNDYYEHGYYPSLIRWVRLAAFILTVISPAAYVALTSFHPELLPTPLLITMAAATEGAPFPSAVEVLGMGLVFEVLREAGVRMPRAIGQAVSIVGALVIGQATVSAGLVGAPVVIVVAITAVASFVVPAQAGVSTILRTTLTVFAAVLGAYGIAIGLLVVLVHLCSLRSFGVPYLSPIAPLSPGDLKDVPMRAPLWDMFERPRLIGWRNPQRQKFRLKPAPPAKKK